MRQLHRYPLLAVIALLYAACGGDGKRITPPTQTSITLSTASATLIEGDSLRLTWTLSGFQTTPNVTLSSSAGGVATVAASGWVRAVAPGSARIIAQAGSVADTTEIQVTQRAVALAFVNMPDTVAAGSGNAAVQVRVTDARNDGVAGVQVRLVPLYTGGQESTVAAGTDGVANFTVAAPTEAGEYEFEARVAQPAGIVPDTAVLVVTAADAAVLTIGGDDEVALQVGDTARLTTSFTDAFGNPAPALPITWVSSNDQVAAVAAGLVEATGAGSASILAIAGVLRDSVRAVVTLPPPSNATIAPASASFTALLDTVQFSLTLTTPQGDTVTGQPVTWSVLNNSIASVDTQGRVVALAPGATRVIGTSGALSDTADITVAQVPASVDVSSASVSLNAVGATAPLSAVVADANGQTVAGAAVAWSSLDPAVATVNTSGLVTAVSNGVARIVGTTGAFADTAVVTVAQVAASVAITVPADTMQLEGETQQITAAYADANGFPVAGIVTTWSSSADTIASVDATGIVTAEAVNGTAWIRAQGGPVTDSVAVVVRDVAFVLYTAANSSAAFNMQVAMHAGATAPATAYIYSEAGALLARRTGPTINYTFPSGLDGTIKRVEFKANRAQVQAIEAAQDSLVGTFPEGILDLPNLAVLNLAYNPRLTGSLPAGFGTLTGLAALELFSTGLSGALPANFGNLINLDILNLSDTQFSGSVAMIQNLTDLWYLNLGRTAFSGDMPELGGLVALIQVYIDGSGLNGYTGGLDELSLVTDVDFSDANLPAGDIDRILADLVTSVTAAPRGGTVNLGGTNAAPSPPGLTYVTTLEGLGWTVTVAP